MKFALYGMPCAGKTTLFNELEMLTKINGSERLKSLAQQYYHSDFRSLNRVEQNHLRDLLVQDIRHDPHDNIIVDGHYAFGDKVVFTDADGSCYDVFLYLYEDPTILRSRMNCSEKNSRYLSYNLKEWQSFEINALRHYCLVHKKDFYVIDQREYLKSFIEDILNGYSTVFFAKRVVEKIITMYQKKRRIIILDGDKTLSSCDISRRFFHYETQIFDGNFYTGFQFWLQNKDFSRMDNSVTPDMIPLNLSLVDQINPHEAVLLTCGHPVVWNKIADQLHIPLCVSGAEVSADTKYHIVNELQAMSPDKEIISHGDSYCDWFMLKASKGTLWVKNKVSRSFSGQEIEGVDIRYVPWVLLDEDISLSTWELCEASKSSSGISGNALSNIHEQLGERLGQILNENYNDSQTTMICLLRGGLFLAAGIYRKFNCKFLLFNPNHDSITDLTIDTDNVLLVDSVINSGETLLRMIHHLKDKNVIIAAGVIQRESLRKFCEYPTYLCRVSNNKFKGVRSKIQVGLYGPDTSDRLFNLI